MSLESFYRLYYELCLEGETVGIQPNWAGRCKFMLGIARLDCELKTELGAPGLC